MEVGAYYHSTYLSTYLSSKILSFHHSVVDVCVLVWWKFEDELRAETAFMMCVDHSNQSRVLIKVLRCNKSLTVVSKVEDVCKDKPAPPPRIAR